MDDELLTVRVDRTTTDKLDQLVRDCDCSRDDLLRDAVIQFVNEQSKLIAAIKEGEADVDEGRVVTHEQLLEELRIAYTHKDAA